MTDILKSQTVLVASTNDTTGQTVQVSNCQSLTLTITAAVSAATLSATVRLCGTNDDTLALNPSSTLPTLNTGAAITVAPAEIVYDDATGLLTFTNPAIGTHEVTLAFSSFPKWVRPVYDYTSGGGTVDLRVVIGAWSV